MEDIVAGVSGTEKERNSMVFPPKMGTRQTLWALCPFKSRLGLQPCHAWNLACVWTGGGRRVLSTGERVGGSKCPCLGVSA